MWKLQMYVSQNMVEIYLCTNETTCLFWPEVIKIYKRISDNFVTKSYKILLYVMNLVLNTPDIFGIQTIVTLNAIFPVNHGTNVSC